jgi:hypothetical protein
MAFAVLWQSSPSKKLVIVQAPFESEAKRTALCEMLLSGGTVISVSMRAALRDLSVCFSLDAIIS